MSRYDILKGKIVPEPLEPQEDNGYIFNPLAEKIVQFDFVIDQEAEYDEVAENCQEAVKKIISHCQANGLKHYTHPIIRSCVDYTSSTKIKYMITVHAE